MKTMLPLAASTVFEVLRTPLNAQTTNLEITGGGKTRTIEDLLIL